MPRIHFSNLQLADDTDYFLYIGELKNYGLNHFLCEALSRIFHRRFGFIAVVPDIFEQYNYDNLVVINPRSETDDCKYGSNYNCRVSAAAFMTCVSENGQIRALVRQLLNRQRTLYIYMYESLPEMTLDAIDGVRVLGPASEVARRVNDKIYQLLHLEGRLPVVDFKVCHTRGELLDAAEGLWRDWRDGIFVSKNYSAAGVNSILARNTAEVSRRFPEEDGPFYLSRYLPHDHDPTVLAVVAGAQDVFVAGVADQRIENGVNFTGSTFPTRLPADIVAELRRHTVNAGKWLAEEGYRGIFGCDFVVTPGGEIRFLEINARKQGTTLEFCCTLEQNLPPGSPNLPELEYYAVEQGLFPVHTTEMRSNPSQIFWGTYNYKLSRTVRTDGYIPQSSQERAAFRKVAAGNLKKTFLILEHTGSDFVVANGSFLARIVALGHDHQSVRQGLVQGKKTIDLTISDDFEEASNG